AVAFDVYRASGGHYLERVAVMVATTIIFWAVVADQQVRFMRADKILFSPREWASLFWFFLVKPGGLRAIVPLYLDYFRPGFHPWDLDNRDLLETWKRDYAPAG
ncbi:MAG: metal-dependent hydrolase, partial [Candidatus Methylomirabilis sp.]|nr:metal-dependent hydrolase [Deltaproteobacteria bacterium]